MKSLLRPVLAALSLPTLALAIYAPIPEQEQGKALTYRLGASVSHDDNIFGAPDLEDLPPGSTDRVVDSMVYNFSARIAFNGSVTDQTFATLSYDLSNDHVVDRPGDNNLTNHGLFGRLAHSFSPDSNIDLSGSYDIVENPVSALPGRALSADQSYDRAEFNTRFTTNAGQKTGVVGKYRFMNYAYDNALLAEDLDRAENLLGFELSHAFLPETKLVGEYRFQSIRYDEDGAFKDKDSHFLMAGVDYSPSKQWLVSSRLGFEDRSRESQPGTTVPFVELSSRYTYADESFLSAGYTHTLEEPSDTAQFNDTKVNRFFANVQHRLSPAFVFSGSLTYEPSELQGRRPVADVEETTTRVGLGLSWQPNKNWTVSGTYDYDSVDSDLVERGQERNRLGVSAAFTF